MFFSARSIVNRSRTTSDILASQLSAIHPGEYLVLTSLIAMLKDPRIGKLLPDIDIGTLEKRKTAAESARNYFNVYGHEF